MTDTLLTDFTLSLAQSGIERDTLLYDLTDAEAVALLTPLLDKARAAGAAEMKERCVGVAEQQAQEFLSPDYAAGQPLASFSERFACDEVVKAIRSLT